MKVKTLVELAEECQDTISSAENDGLVINDSNVIDLLADNILDCPLDTFRHALVCAGLAQRFPQATHPITDCQTLN
jgi:hypothetical protein